MFLDVEVFVSMCCYVTVLERPFSTLGKSGLSFEQRLPTSNKNDRTTVPLYMYICSYSPYISLI